MRRRTRQKLIKLATAAGVLATCGAGFGYAALQALGRPTADAFGCFADLEQPQTLVLVDASEPRWNDEQARSLRRYFDQLYQDLEFNERLSIYTSEGDQVASVARPRFHVCGQASRPEQLEAVNAQGAQAGYLRKQRQRLYERVLAPELEAILAMIPDPSRAQFYQSPVMELIADLSRNRDLKAGSRLIVISDLLQNSDSARFCRAKGDMPRFSVFEDRPVYQRLKPEPLDGVRVEMLMLQRFGYGQDDLRYCKNEDELRSFWRDYLTANGISEQDVRFIRIRHGLIED